MMMMMMTMVMMIDDDDYGDDCGKWMSWLTSLS